MPDDSKTWEYALDLASSKRQEAERLGDEMAQLTARRLAAGDVLGAIAAQHDGEVLAARADCYRFTRTQLVMVREQLAADVARDLGEDVREAVAEERAKERATCSVCLARTYRGEECVCEDAGDAEDYDEVLAEEVR
jgi:hypothetical protein